MVNDFYSLPNRILPSRWFIIFFHHFLPKICSFSCSLLPCVPSHFPLFYPLPFVSAVVLPSHLYPTRSTQTVTLFLISKCWHLMSGLVCVCACMWLCMFCSSTVSTVCVCVRGGERERGWRRKTDRWRERVWGGGRDSEGGVKFMLINHVVSSTGLCLSPAVSGVWCWRYSSHIQTHTRK